MTNATFTALESQASISYAFINGMRDFFLSQYGKKTFHMPSGRPEPYMENKEKQNICVFVPHSYMVADAVRMARKWAKTYPKMKIFAITPRNTEEEWQQISEPDAVLTYTRLGNGEIPLADRYRIMTFLTTKPMNLLFTSPLIPRMGTIWGKPVVRTDFSKGTIIAIEKTELRQFCRILVETVSALLRALLNPPEKIPEIHSKIGDQ